MKPPALSVVTAVYNGEPWLAEALDSIVGQTFHDFEFIVVDDGSVDGTAEILAARGDPRVRVIRQARAGQTRALNRGLALASAPVLARMDADDVSLPDRFAKQLAFLGGHPEVGLLGTGSREISGTGRALRLIAPPADDCLIRRALIRANPFVHSSVMFRRAALEAAGGYDERFAVAQDYDLWLRMSRVTRLANLPEPLVLRRVAAGQLSSAQDTTRLRDEVGARVRALRDRAYPLWCAVFLVKPLCALALPPRVRHLLRQRLRRRPA